jgi:hypothetical protein
MSAPTNVTESNNSPADLAHAIVEVLGNADFNTAITAIDIARLLKIHKAHAANQSMGQ